MELVNITARMPEKEPKIRIYDNYLVINAAGTKLLGLRDGDYLQINESAQSVAGKRLLYIGKPSVVTGSYEVKKRKNTMRINCRLLARMMKEKLDGRGCYRICPEDTLRVSDTTWYNIFFKNYDKKNTD